MKIRIFRCLPDDYRKSMEVYADSLIGNLRQICSHEDEIEDVRPTLNTNTSFSTIARIQRYYSQYVQYQVKAKSSHGDVNHIIDPGYGHLVFSLDKHRTLVTVHDLILLKLMRRELPCNYYPPKAILAHRYSLRGIKEAVGIITDSQATKCDLLRFTGCEPAKIHVVYPGVDERFQVIENSWRIRDITRKYSLPESRFMLHVGHCEFYKNIDGILRALYILVRDLKMDVYFLKVGSKLKPEQKVLAARLGLEDRVIELGRLPDEDLVLIYNIADVLVFPSYYEGFGLPVLEAMACGTPVVVSNVASLPEVVGNAGLMVQCENHRAIAEAIGVVLTNKGFRQELIQQGVKQAKKFPRGKTAEGVFAIYKRIVATSQKNHRQVSCKIVPDETGGKQ